MNDINHHKDNRIGPLNATATTNVRVQLIKKVPKRDRKSLERLDLIKTFVAYCNAF